MFLWLKGGNILFTKSQNLINLIFHFSISNSIFNATEIGATAFGLFVRSPRTWKSTPLAETEITKWKTTINSPISCSDDSSLTFKYNLKYILPHGSYLANLGNYEDEKRAKSLELFKEELQICKTLGITMLNIHPGSTRGQISVKKCIELIAESINTACNEITDVN